MTRTPAPALSPAEAARVAAFDAAPVPPEVVVETVARAMFERPLGEGGRASWHEVSEGIRQSFRADAGAAIAALPPSPAEAAVKRVEALADELLSDAESAITPGYYRDAADRLRAALTSPASAPMCRCGHFQHVHGQDDTACLVWREIDQGRLYCPCPSFDRPDSDKTSSPLADEHARTAQ